VAETEADELMPGVELAPGPMEAIDGADAVVLVTEWEEFTALDWKAVAERMNGRLLIDGRNALDPEAVRAGGLDYEGIGRR
jgi:UDPglucose 6-dehydrogenase